MKKEEAKIILKQILMNSNNWITSKELASQMHVTSRSIRNYICEMNKENNTPMILASEKGYLWNHAKSDALLFYDKLDVPLTPETRVLYILRDLVYNDQTTYDNLIDALYVSDSTLEKDLLNVRRALKEYNLKLQIKNNHLTIHGNELDLRRLSVNCILSSNRTSSPRYSYVKIIFDQREHLPVDALRQLLLNAIDHYDLDIFGYGINIILLYILIAIFRQKKGYHFDSTSSSHKNLILYPDYQAAQEINQWINQTFNFKNNENELDYITMVLLSRTHYRDISNEELKNICNPEMYSTVWHALQDLDQAYDLHLTQYVLINELVIHLQRVPFKRIDTNVEILTIIQSQYPFLYDISLYVLSKIAEEYAIPINDQNISYICLHIGNYLTDEEINQEKIKTTLICPHHRELQNSLVSKLQDQFGKYITIHTIISDISDLKNIQDPLILSTVNLSELPNVLRITPFLNLDDQKQIQHTISSLKDNIYRFRFVEKLMKYLKPEALEFNHSFTDKKDTIHYISEQLLKDGIIDNQFESHVLKRENLAPTSFGNQIALPHADHYYSNDSLLYIIINQKTMSWGKENVHIIIYFALSQKDSSEFKILYNSLSKIFQDKVFLQQMLKVSSYTELLDTFWHACIPR
ncbi:BglG family transcription antiterminator [Absicoccus porci]|uniref:BglG family transcription antiterminator n=1 Tax=Absicoccus porci TaxID=2486576 RepID=UPI003D8C8FEB